MSSKFKHTSTAALEVCYDVAAAAVAASLRLVRHTGPVMSAAGVIVSHTLILAIPLFALIALGRLLFGHPVGTVVGGIAGGFALLVVSLTLAEFWHRRAARLEGER